MCYKCLESSAALPAPDGRLALERQTSLHINVREEIVNQFIQVARDHGRQLAPLTDNLALLNSGLDSLGFAILVNRLESVLGVDPFSADDFRNFPFTLGAFIQCYEEAAALSGDSLDLQATR